MVNLKKYNIKYAAPILNWDEALPLGNGRLGCLLYGDGPLRLALDRVDLWDTRPHPTTLEKGFTYKKLVKLSKSGKVEDWAERARLFEDVYGGLPYPSKITAGRLELDFGFKTERVSSFVDIQTAMANVDFDGVKVQAFTSATRYVGVAKVGGRYALNVHIPDYIRSESLGYPQTEIVRDGGFTYYVQQTKTDFKYGVVVLEKQTETGTELYFTIVTNNDAADFIGLAKAQLESASALGFDMLLNEHKAWWKNYWNKSKISVGDELLEKVYYRSYYLFASCSRKGFYPMPLQGVWTADNDKLPPWKGDYHHDTNTQLSYQSYLKANRLPEGRVFVDYLWSLRSQFKKVAREFYGVKGLLIPGVSTIDGKPMGGWAQYSLSPTMSIWSAQSFDEYYLYTGDLSFLKNKAYPFFKDIAEAFIGLLEERNDKLYLPLSTSPEIHDDMPSAYLEPNSNFDLALMRYLFATMCRYCQILQKDGGRYEAILNKLDEIATLPTVDFTNGTPRNCISLDKKQGLNESHRHFSHLMCMYPLHLINYDTAEHKKLYEDALYDIERLGMGAWVGFSYAMCAQIYAMAEKGNGAYEKLRQFADGFVAENGFHLNGDFQNKGYSTFHYRPFTLESSFGFCDAFQEMLLQEHQGYLHLFPAIPQAWASRELSFSNLRSYGGVLVTAKKKGGRITGFSVKSNAPTEIRIRNDFGAENLTFSNGEKIHCKQGEIFTLRIKNTAKLVTK